MDIIRKNIYGAWLMLRIIFRVIIIFLTVMSVNVPGYTQEYKCNCTGSINSPQYFKFYIKKAGFVGGEIIRLNVFGSDYQIILRSNEVKALAQLYQVEDEVLVVVWNVDGHIIKKVKIKENWEVMENAEDFDFSDLSPELVKEIKQQLNVILLNFDALTSASF